MAAAVLDSIERHLLALREGVADPTLPPCPYVSDQYIAGRDYQVGVAHLLLKPRFVLGDVTGFGKTPQALVAYAYLRWKQPEAKLFVLTRLSALRQWQHNVARFLVDTRAEILGCDPAGREWTEKDAAERRAAQVARWVAGEFEILISTYHTPALDWSTRVVPTAPEGKKPDRPYRVFEFPVLPSLLVTVCDECQIVRGEGTLLHPFTAALVSVSRYAWGLTATQLHTRLDDIFHIYNVLRPGMLGLKRDFDRRYYTRVLLKKGQRRFWKITGTQHLWALMDAIRPYYLRRESAALPGIHYKLVQTVLGKAQRALYTEVLQQYLPAVQQTGYATADRLATRTAADRAHGISKVTALTYAQFAVDAPEVLGLPDVPSAKLDELVTFLQDDAADQKVIVYSRYEQVVTAIASRLTREGIACVRITGKESATQRAAAQTTFQTSPDCRVIVLNSAGGEALDLQAAGVVVLYDLPWSWGEFAQVLGRARRHASQHRCVLVVLLGSLKTIDERSLTILQRREHLFDVTFGLNPTDPRLAATSYTAPQRGDTPAPEAGALPASFVADLFRAVKDDLPG